MGSETRSDLVEHDQPALLQVFEHRILCRSYALLDLLNLFPEDVVLLEEITKPAI